MREMFKEANLCASRSLCSKCKPHPALRRCSLHTESLAMSYPLAVLGGIITCATCHSQLGILFLPEGTVSASPRETAAPTSNSNSTADRLHPSAENTRTVTRRGECLAGKRHNVFQTKPFTSSWPIYTSCNSPENFLSTFNVSSKCAGPLPCTGCVSELETVRQNIRYKG